MHMADALISPEVGGAMWIATAATAAYCAKKVREENDSSKIPLMGVAGAFIFAAQMLNFTIPGTGSSGHLGGGLILAILLGPYAAFLTMASILTVQALFFADGGILALGCNIFNLGFFPAFIAYPLFKKIVGDNWAPARVIMGSIVGVQVGLLLGAFGVVLETTFSGISSLTFSNFVLMMIPIHIAIALVEGLVTAAVVLFVRQAQPELLARTADNESIGGLRLRNVVVGLAIAAVLSGVAFAWFASTNPDGLEWSIAKVTGSEEIEEDTSVGLREMSAALQEKTALLPDYAFKEETTEEGEDTVVTGAEATTEGTEGAVVEEETAEEEVEWPAVDSGTSTAGIVGAGITLGVAVAIGYVLTRRRKSESLSSDGSAA